MPAASEAAWALLESRIPRARKNRPLAIHILAEDSEALVTNSSVAAINVHARGLNAHAPHSYNMREVTGIGFAVQCIFVMQQLTAQVLYEACQQIELGDLGDFTFVCRHATHRSCGCALLLATLVYPSARIIFSTRRTIEAAVERGMVLMA